MPELSVKGTRLQIETDRYSAAVDTEGYVSGVAAGSFVDRATGSRDPGYGLMIVDFLLEPGVEPPGTPTELHYPVDDAYHGNIHKRFVALPQICTQAKTLPHEITRGAGYVAVRQWFTWNIACPPYPAGSCWEQTLLFPDGKRWFLAWDRFSVSAVNETSDQLSPSPRLPVSPSCIVLRMDMPCHIKHHGGDVFDSIYLSYRPGSSAVIPQTEFHQNFPPQAKFLYRRGRHVPSHYIRAIKLTGGPWLAGIALDPSIVYEAWCHQRDYVCMIEEFGGKKTRAGQWQSAVHLAGWFDSIDEMRAVADQYHGAKGLVMSDKGWRTAPARMVAGIGVLR